MYSYNPIKNSRWQVKWNHSITITTHSREATRTDCEIATSLQSQEIGVNQQAI